MKKKNQVLEINKIKKDLEKELNNEYSNIIKEMVKEKMKTIKMNEYHIEKLKKSSKDIQKEIDDILSGKVQITEKDLIQYKGNRDYNLTTYI